MVARALDRFAVSIFNNDAAVGWNNALPLSAKEQSESSELCCEKSVDPTVPIKVYGLLQPIEVVPLAHQQIAKISIMCWK
jgi:hypothetical protein